MESKIEPNLIKDDFNYFSVTTQEEYLKLFPESIRNETVKQILDIRKFEIELYWKRSTYYWTLIAAIFTGYFVTFANFSSEPNKLKILFVLNCLGILFSTGWYFVNRGSKFWQVNWEKHLDVLESSVIGPLYKTNISTEYYFKRFRNLIAPFPFSVSKVNQILNLMVMAFWIGLFTYTLYEYQQYFLSDIFFYSIFSALLLLGLFFLYASTHTGKDWCWEAPKRNRTHINFEKRGVQNERVEPLKGN